MSDPDDDMFEDLEELDEMDEEREIDHMFDDDLQDDFNSTAQ